MSYICDGCGKTAKLVATKKGNYLCDGCYKKESNSQPLDRTMGRCHNCDRYFEMHESPDGGHTCSKKCSSEYLAYLNEGIEKPFHVTTIKEVENPTKEDLVGHRKIDLMHEYDEVK